MMCPPLWIHLMTWRGHWLSEADPLVRAGPPGPASSNSVLTPTRPTGASAADQGVRPTIRARRLETSVDLAGKSASATSGRETN
jgi:hypothetical protein